MEEDGGVWFAPAHVRTEDRHVEMLREPQRPEPLSPEVTRAAPGGVRDQAEQEAAAPKLHERGHGVLIPPLEPEHRLSECAAERTHGFGGDAQAEDASQPTLQWAHASLRILVILEGYASTEFLGAEDKPELRSGVFRRRLRCRTQYVGELLARAVPRERVAEVEQNGAGGSV